MKKLLAFLLAMALLISASATVFALSGMDSKTESGNIKIGNKTYHYDCVLRASTAQFSARMTYEYYDVYISCSANPTVSIYGDNVTGRSKSATGQGSVSVSGDNSLSLNGNEVYGTIIWVQGIYKIQTQRVATINLT